MYKKALLVFVFLFTLVFSLNADNTLVVGVENEPSRINPLFDEDHDPLVELIYSGLVYHDTEGRLQPDLAKSWTISDDGLKYHFILRSDVKWHDGVKFSANDVKFTIESAQNPKIQSTSRENFKLVEKINIINDNELEIILKKPFIPLLAVLSKGILPKHLLEGKDINTAAFNSKPIGTGPYKLVEWKKGSFAKLAVNKDFHLGKVNNDGVLARFIPSSSLRALALKGGEIDAALVEPAMKKQFLRKGFSVLMMPSTDYRGLSLNQINPIFKDAKTRQALNFAVDRKSIVKNLLLGMGSPATGPFIDMHPEDDFNYDIKKAKQLLKEAGWVMGKNGILQRDGKEFKFDIYAFNTDMLRVKISKVLENDFAKLGVKVRVYGKPPGSFDYTRVDSFLVGYGNPYDMGLENSKIFSGYSGNNFSNYHNKEVDKTLAAFNSAMDKDKRKQYAMDFLKELRADPAFVFVVYLDYPLVYKDNIKGVKKFTLGHHGAGFLADIWHWSKK